MLNLEEKIREWKSLLDAGIIDETTYNKEINKLKRSNEEFNFIKVFPIILIFLVICMSVIRFDKSNNVDANITDNNKETDNVEYVKSLSNIPKPTQSRTSGNTTKIINAFNVEITYVAKYSISGRVVDVQNYYGKDIESKLSPKDVGISWGFLAEEENHRKVTWSSPGNRYLNWYTTDVEWIKQNGGSKKINESCSNNHLIPGDETNNKLINKIKEGDFVRIEGYLVNVYCNKDDGSYFYWNTSTSRNDSGGGACEIVYVTSVTWIEKE